MKSSGKQNFLVTEFKLCTLTNFGKVKLPGGERGGQILEFLDGGESRSESFWMGGRGQILEFLDGAPITTFFEF